MGDERGEKRWLDGGAIRALEELRRRYGPEYTDSDLIRLLVANKRDLDELVRDRAKKLRVG